MGLDGTGQDGTGRDGTGERRDRTGGDEIERDGETYDNHLNINQAPTKIKESRGQGKRTSAEGAPVCIR